MMNDNDKIKQRKDILVFPRNKNIYEIGILCCLLTR